jgi:hypothetical protein
MCAEARTESDAPRPLPGPRGLSDAGASSKGEGGRLDPGGKQHPCVQSPGHLTQSLDGRAGCGTGRSDPACLPYTFSWPFTNTRRIRTTSPSTEARGQGICTPGPTVSSSENEGPRERRPYSQYVGVVRHRWEGGDGPQAPSAPPRSRHIAGRPRMERRPIDKTARTVEIFPREVVQVDRRRDRWPGQSLASPGFPFPSWGAIGSLARPFYSELGISGQRQPPPGICRRPHG